MPENKQPILSICIPTFNRSGYLYFTLKSIVEQDIFINSYDIEIVISDNCSEDLTEKISRIFADKFPDKIIYNKNETNIGDLNFEKVLSLAHGEVLKLHNDNFLFLDGALDKIVEEVKSQRSQKPMIFFSNGNSRIGKSKLCSGMNEFMEAASYLTTWSAAFSIWKEDFDKFEDFAKNIDTYLTQTDVVFRFCASGKKMLIFDDPIFEGQGVLKKGGYNIAKIFGRNYLSLLKPYLKTGQLDKKVYEHEKKVLLLNHIIPMRFSSSRREKGWQFQNDGYWRYLIENYHSNAYFYTSIVKIFRLLLDAELNLIYRKLKKNSFQKYWRKRNTHNQTTIDKNIDESKVFVGKNVVGHISATFSDNPRELLIIDDDVVIDDNTKFDLSAEELILVTNDKKLTVPSAL